MQTCKDDQEKWKTPEVHLSWVRLKILLSIQYFFYLVYNKFAKRIPNFHIIPGH